MFDSFASPFSYIYVDPDFMWLLQDAFAIQSFERGIAARDAGAFAWEITPVRFQFLCLAAGIFVVCSQLCC